MNKANQYGNMGAGLVAAVALHYVGTSPELFSAGVGVGANLFTALCTVYGSVVGGVLTKQLTRASEVSKANLNHDLETAILAAYRETFKQIEEDLIEEFKIKESKIKNFVGGYIHIENSELDNLIKLHDVFIAPILTIILDDEIITGMLKENEQIFPDEFLKKIIERSLPEYGQKNKVGHERWVEFVCDRFKKYFSQHFMTQLKIEDRAKTAYFTHLLENIIINTQDIKKEFPIIRDFASQTNLNLSEILKFLSDNNENAKILQEEFTAFKENVEITTKSIEAKIKESIGPVLYKRDYKKTDEKPDDLKNKFNYKYQYLDLVGRNEELSRLWNFIGSKDDRVNFRWWMITGQGGMGKSRIAQHLCLSDKGYYSGFFEFKKVSANPSWDVWVPDMPTIIVIDYALSKIENVVEIIKSLKQRSDKYKYPVRLLLLDREVNEIWKKKLNTIIELEDSLYKEDLNSESSSLELKPLDDKFSWNIVEQVIKKEKEAKWTLIETKKEEILKSLHFIDSLHRPLFTFLAAMSFAIEDDIRYWNTNNLLMKTLSRFEGLWSQYVDNDALEDKIKTILLLNTLYGKLTNNDLEKLIKSFNIGINLSELTKSYLFIADHEFKNNKLYWNGLQPDILGEFFILKGLQGILLSDTQKGEKVVDKILSHSSTMDVEYTISMIYMIWYDFQLKKTDALAKIDLFEKIYIIIKSSNNDTGKNYLSKILKYKGHVNYLYGFYEDGIKDLNRAIELNNTDYELFELKGDINYACKKYVEAVINLTDAITLNKLDSSLYHLRGVCKVFQDDYKGAIVDFDVSIYLKDDFDESYSQRAMCRHALGCTYDEVVADLDKAIQLNGNKTVNYNHRGILKMSYKLYAEALKDFDKFSELVGETASVVEMREKCLLLLESS